MSGGSLARRLHQRILDDGPISVGQWIEAALYDPDDGFYMTGGQAGRRADFLTAPEVGPLFGAVLARAVDDWWVEFGRPDPFPVFEVGAGPGTLARAVLRAGGEAERSGALRWWAVEISPMQRKAHPQHELLRSAATLDEACAVAWEGSAGGRAGVVLANELLDNLPFEILEMTNEGWCEVRVSSTPDGRFETVSGGLARNVALDMARLGPEVGVGVRVPWQSTARKWLDAALSVVPKGRVVVFDYGASTSELSARADGWLRTHRDHRSEICWLDDPGSADITADVAFDQLQLDHPASSVRTQSEFLRAHGIDEMVEEGRRTWRDRAHVGDLAALEARSRVREAEALCELGGMGSFVVSEWFS